MATTDTESNGGYAIFVHGISPDMAGERIQTYGLVAGALHGLREGLTVPVRKPVQSWCRIDLPSTIPPRAALGLTAFLADVADTDGQPVSTSSRRAAALVPSPEGDGGRWAVRPRTDGPLDVLQGVDEAGEEVGYDLDRRERLRTAHAEQRGEAGDDSLETHLSSFGVPRDLAPGVAEASAPQVAEYATLEPEPRDVRRQEERSPGGLAFGCVALLCFAGAAFFTFLSQFPESTGLVLTTGGMAVGCGLVGLHMAIVTRMPRSASLLTLTDDGRVRYEAQVLFWRRRRVASAREIGEARIFIPNHPDASHRNLELKTTEGRRFAQLATPFVEGGYRSLLARIRRASPELRVVEWWAGRGREERVLLEGGSATGT